MRAENFSNRYRHSSGSKMATVAEPAGPLTDQATLKDSAFIKAQRYAAKDTDVARDVDVSAAAENEESGLDQVMSGPMLTRPTVDGEDSDLADVLDVPFSEICHSGLAWNWKNCLIKIWRYTIVPIKEVYLPLMTWGLPTNFLMLTWRTFNRDFDLPNHNDDYLAPLLRDTLMPVRGKQHREKSPFLKWKTGLLDTPWLGLPGIVNFIDVRTQWFDAAVNRAITDGIKQVVIIAAGYDTRAYRFGRPGVHFYEIDLPHASEKKKELVKEHMPADKYIWPEFVGADLAKVSLMEALSRTSFDSTKRTMFIIEGLVYYLPPGAFKQQLTAISETAVRGSRLFFDFMHLDALSGEVFRPGLETLLVSVWNKGEHMYSGVDPRPEAVKCLLKKFGFRLYELLDAKQITARFHPHCTKWSEASPHVSPYFGYIAAEKVTAPLKRQETINKKR